MLKILSYKDRTELYPARTRNAWVQRASALRAQRLSQTRRPWCKTSTLTLLDLIKVFTAPFSLFCTHIDEVEGKMTYLDSFSLTHVNDICHIFSKAKNLSSILHKKNVFLEVWSLFFLLHNKVNLHIDRRLIWLFLSGNQICHLPSLTTIRSSVSKCYNKEHFELSFQEVAQFCMDYYLHGFFSQNQEQYLKVTSHSILRFTIITKTKSVFSQPAKTYCCQKWRVSIWQFL